MKRSYLLNFEALVPSSDRKELSAFFLACIIELLQKRMNYLAV